MEDTEAAADAVAGRRDGASSQVFAISFRRTPFAASLVAETSAAFPSCCVSRSSMFWV